jgi:hypothetical protein
MTSVPLRSAGFLGRRHSQREFSATVKQAALYRVDFRCERCGARRQLEVHHMSRRDPSGFSCVVLCHDCRRNPYLRWAPVDGDLPIDFPAAISGKI